MIKHGMSLLLLVFLALLALGSSDSGSGGGAGTSSPSSLSPPAVTAGEDKHISGDHRFGCTEREYFEKLVSYAVQKDNDAFSQGLAAGMLTGKCTLFKPDESIYITDTAILSGLVEVRRKGEVQEYWTNLEAVH